MTADEYYDDVITRVASGQPGDRSLVPEDDLRAGALRRLAEPDRRGMALAWVWRDFEDADPNASREALEARVRDTALPRHVRARFASILATADADAWQTIVDELPEEDEYLGFEGFLEYELTLQHGGLARDLAGSLEEVPEENRADLAPTVERVRRLVGLRASSVWADVVERPALAPMWPIACAALVDEGSPEALAALDLGLLVTKGEAATPLAEARRALVAAHPTATRPAPTGEAYVHLSVVDGELWGLIAQGSGGARLHTLFEMPPLAAVQVLHLEGLPAELSKTSAAQLWTRDGAVEAPFDEVLALVARGARAGIEGENAAALGALKALLSKAPPLPPLVVGQPYDDAELEALCAEGSLSPWLASPEELEKLGASLLAVAEDREMPHPEALLALSVRVEHQARILAWKGEAGPAARLAAHVGRDVAPMADFLRLAFVWVAERMKRVTADAD